MAHRTTQTILCTWEIGGELGHISQLAAVSKSLEREGFHVVVALRDLSRAHSFFSHMPTTLVQAPVWLPQITLQRPIACLADSLLLLGYLEVEPLYSLVNAWTALVDYIKPDAVVFDYSPTAMLALLERPIPKMLIGTGFADPVPGQPIIDWRPYSVNDGLVLRQEQRVLQQINAVLKRTNRQPLKYLADLFVTDRVFINNFPELDIYHRQRKIKTYCLNSTEQMVKAPSLFCNSQLPRIIAYLKPSYGQLELLVQALALVEANVFIVCPHGQSLLFERYLSSTFQFSLEVIDLASAIAEADLFVGHGNGLSVKESLASGTPVVVLPIHLEQLITGKKIQEHGFGLLIETIATSAELAQILNGALASIDVFCNQLKELQKQYSLPGISVAEAVSNACTEFFV